MTPLGKWLKQKLELSLMRNKAVWKVSLAAQTAWLSGRVPAGKRVSGIWIGPVVYG